MRAIGQQFARSLMTTSLRSVYIVLVYGTTIDYIIRKVRIPFLFSFFIFFLNRMFGVCAHSVLAAEVGAG